MSEDCLHCHVTGRVQGVFFRASARAEAQRLGLRGFARNLADGGVEVAACGEPAAIRAFRRWLGDGPPQARVEAVEDTGRSVDRLPAGFEVR